MNTESILRELAAVHRAMVIAGADYRDLAFRRRQLATEARNAGATLTQVADAIGIRHRATVHRLLNPGG